MRLEHWVYTIPLRLRSLFRRRRVEQELDEELRYHLERRIEEEIAQGCTPEEARYAALRAMEGLEQQKERCRDARRVNLVENLLQDLRYAGRMMRKNPGFTAVAAGCLALGIGANTAIFSLMNAVLLKSLPVKDPEQLVVLRYVAKKNVPREIRRVSSGYGSMSLSYATFEHLRRHSRLAASVFGFVPLGFNDRSVTVSLGGQPSLAAVEMVTGEYFSGLGVSPVLGRSIAETDRRPDAARVAVISYGYWVSRFGRESSVIGRTMALNRVPFTIIGAMPPEFFGVNPQFCPDIWIPLREEAGLAPWGSNAGKTWLADDRWWWLNIMVRRQPGIRDEQARAELDVLFQQSITAGLNPPPKAEDLPHLDLVPAGQGLNFLRKKFSKPLWVLLIAVGLVLILACANVATLLLARATARQKEMSVRLATGASRWRLIRQLLTESLLLASGGGALGLLLAWWGSPALLFLMSDRRTPIALEVHPDSAALAFCVAVSLLTGILFGLAPAFRATRFELARTLKENSTAVSTRLGLGSVLVTGQVAISLLLLIGAGLYIRTLRNLENQDLGFDRRNLLLFALDARRGGATPDRIRATYDQVLERLQALPGVRSATASQLALLTGWINNGGIATDGEKLPPGASNNVYSNCVGPAFFETMGIGLVLGRGIEWRDIRSTRRVAVVNEALSRFFFPGESPLGHHVNFSSEPAQDYEIVGVVRNARYDSLHEEPPRTVYVPYTAVPAGNLYFEVRTAGDPAALVPIIQRIVQDIDANLPLKDVKTQSEQIDESLRQERMFARLSAFFGALALLLVAVGLYGTLAYGVTRRTNEIGIRMALGAQRAQVIWMVLKESLILIGAGVVIGLPVALATTRYIASQLFGVQPNDAPTIVATVLVLVSVGAAAGYLPARRAARVAPTVALRYE